MFTRGIGNTMITVDILSPVGGSKGDYGKGILIRMCSG